MTYTVVSRPIESPSLLRWRELFHQSYGKNWALVFLFDVQPSPQAMGSNYGLISLLVDVLSHSDVRAAAPSLIEGERIAPAAVPQMAFFDALDLDSVLAKLVIRGGAYGGRVCSVDEGKALARGIVREIFEERWEDLQCFEDCSSWSKWFRDLAWDRTVLVVDSVGSQAMLVLTTDED